MLLASKYVVFPDQPAMPVEIPEGHAAVIVAVSTQ
jgi:hypothetical protein